jgi:hypothetical protein
VDRPERFLASVPPNPEAIAKAQDMAAAAALKTAQAKHIGAEMTLDHASANEKMANTVHTMGQVGEQTHRIHQEAHRVVTQGIIPPEPIEGGGDDGASASAPAPAL